MKIGFDLDKVFIDYPPVVPDYLIDWLFKDHTKKDLAYRFPGQFEQWIRRFSHQAIFRSPIEENIAFVRELAKKRKHKLYLVSSRFSFLKEQTMKLLKKYGISELFYKMEVNFDDKQPHKFKEGVVRKYMFDMYIDDDLPLLRFLANRFPRIQFFWLSKKEEKTYQNGRIIKISKLSDLDQYLL